MKSHLFLLMMLFCSMYSIQLEAKPGDIYGKVVNKDGKLISYANVIVLKAADTTLVKADYTNDNGVYKLSDIANGNYIVKVTMAGYELQTLRNVVVADNNAALPDITLTEKNATLKEVSVRAQKPLIEVRPDMLVVNVENSIVNAGSSALDVLARSPGVTVDQNDNISLKGKQGVNVMINGKLQPISQSDLANMLKALPSSTIDKIELISNPSARYDAAGTAGIINIVMKKDQRMGFNGSVNGAYSQGVYSRVNGGINLNYRDSKFNIYANYSHYHLEGFNHLTLERNFYDNGINDFTYHQNHNMVFPIRNNVAMTGIDYNASANTTVGVGVSGTLNRYYTHGDVSTVASNPNDGDDLLYTASTLNSTTYKWGNYAANGNLKHKFGNDGKQLTADVDYAQYITNGTQDLTTKEFDPGGLPLTIPYILHGDIAGNTQIRSLKADYVDPMKNGAKLEVGIKTSYVTADNEPLFYDESSGVAINDTTKSNHYVYNENINAAYVNASKNFGKWGVQLGVRAEQTNVKGEQRITNQNNDTSYLQLFPSASVQRSINDNNDLGLTLSRRVERPNYEQLNPFRYYLDPTTYKEGNPYLKPATSYNIELSHTFKKRFVTTLSYSTTSNVITNVLLPAPNRLTIQTDVNIGQMRYYGLSCAYPFQITKWWSNVTNLNAYYSEYIGDLANTDLKNGRPTFDITTNNSFLLPNNFAAELGLFYQATQAYGFMVLRPMWQLNAGIQRTMLDKRLTIRLNVADLFWKGYPSATSTYSGYVEKFVAQRDTRQIALSAVYRFGNRNASPIRKHEGGAQDELRRASQGAG